jgi:hypothetical protein
MIKINNLLLILFFPLIIFSFITCNEDNGNIGNTFTVNSVNELGILLNKLPANTADKPYTILLNVNDLMGISQPIRKNIDKYINIDLSGSTITSIEDKTFEICHNLTGVTIPNSITSIGDRAFSGCNSLTSVNIPNNVTSIGREAFYYCLKLENITIPYGITIIENGIFGGCVSLTNINIPNSVTSIGDFAFSSCASFTNVTIPNNVTNIGKGAFAVCNSLISVTFEGTILETNFNSNNPFPGDLRDKFYAEDADNGTSGTYTREDGSTTWTRDI